MISVEFIREACVRRDLLRRGLHLQKDGTVGRGGVERATYTVIDGATRQPVIVQDAAASGMTILEIGSRILPDASR